MRKSVIALFVLVVYFCTITGVIASVESTGVIQSSLSSDIRSTNPGVNRDANTDTVMMHILEGLVAYRESGTPGPMLADSIEVSEDEKTYIFRLREGIRFHNGDPVTAEDVVWSWQRYLDPETNWECLSMFDGSSGNRIESIRASNENTVVFQLNRPQPMLLINMADVRCGASAVIHRSSLNPDGSWREPVATGPYKLKSWKRGRYIELEAFQDYQSRKEPRDGFTGQKIAYAEYLRFMIIRDAAARLAALAKGQIDIMPEVPAAQMVQIRRLKQVELKSKPMLVNYLILIQSNDKVMADVRIRKALELSLDRQPIAELVTEGEGVANPSIIPTSSPYYSTLQSTSNGYNLAQARSLLKEAGYNGEPIKMVTNRRYPAMYNQALLVQAVARQSGINIELEVLEWATHLDRWKSGDYQLMSFGFSAKTDPYLNFNSILGDSNLSKTKIWNNPDAIKIYQYSGQTNDDKRRQQLFDQLHRLMLRDVPVIVLYSLSDVNAVQKNITGFESWALGRTRLWGVRPHSI